MNISKDSRGSEAKDVFTWNIKSSEYITNMGQNGLGNICASALLNKDKYVSVLRSCISFHIGRNNSMYLGNSVKAGLPVPPPQIQ